MRDKRTMKRMDNVVFVSDGDLHTIAIKNFWLFFSRNVAIVHLMVRRTIVIHHRAMCWFVFVPTVSVIQWVFIATILSQMKRRTSSLCWRKFSSFANRQNASSVTEGNSMQSNDVRGIHTPLRESLAWLSLAHINFLIGYNGANDSVIEIQKW